MLKSPNMKIITLQVNLTIDIPDETPAETVRNLSVKVDPKAIRVMAGRKEALKGANVLEYTSSDIVCDENGEEI